MIQKTVEVAAPPAAVWHAWATAAGAVTFFAPEARIGGGHASGRRGVVAAETDNQSEPVAEALRPGDPYELLFLDADDAPEGGRGSEGCGVLAQVPGELLAFDWNAPRQYPEVRAAAGKAWVVLTFEVSNRGGAGGTLVRLTHLGFGEGDEWDAVFAYFGRAWDTVLDRLARRFVSGPIDWGA
jgi:uncharacterized protein YndB with AHSA1/START domain